MVRHLRECLRQSRLDEEERLYFFFFFVEKDVVFRNASGTKRSRSIFCEQSRPKKRIRVGLFFCHVLRKYSCFLCIDPLVLEKLQKEVDCLKEELKKLKLERANFSKTLEASKRVLSAKKESVKFHREKIDEIEKEIVKEEENQASISTSVDLVNSKMKAVSFKLSGKSQELSKLK